MKTANRPWSTQKVFLSSKPVFSVSFSMWKNMNLMLDFPAKLLLLLYFIAKLSIVLCKIGPTHLPVPTDAWPPICSNAEVEELLASVISTYPADRATSAKYDCGIRLAVHNSKYLSTAVQSFRFASLAQLHCHFSGLVITNSLLAFWGNSCASEFLSPSKCRLQMHVWHVMVKFFSRLQTLTKHYN